MRAPQLFQKLEQYQKGLCKINQIVLVNMKSVDSHNHISDELISAIDKLDIAKSEAYSWVGYKIAPKEYSLENARLHREKVVKGVSTHNVAMGALATINVIMPELGKLNGKTANHIVVVMSDNSTKKLSTKFIKTIKEVVADLKELVDYFQDVLKLEEKTPEDVTPESEEVAETQEPAATGAETSATGTEEINESVTDKEKTTTENEPVEGKNDPA